MLKNTRALWLGFEESKQLLELKNAIDDEMYNIGLKFENRIYSPHLTIGRTKFIKNRSQLQELLDSYSESHFQNFKVSDIIFYESILTSEGSIYKEIEKFDLNISSL
jgi:2'-5' RNA ligase